VQYDLRRWRGFFFQAIKDNTDFKRELFQYYIKKKGPFFVLYSLIEKFKNGFLGYIVGLTFYLVIYIFIRFPRDKKYISMLQLSTEKKSYRDIFGANGSEIGLIHHSFLVSCLPLKSLAFKTMLCNFRILNLILRRYDLFIALRGIQYLAYYDRFNLEIDKKDTSVIIVFTDGNPHGRALMETANKKEIKLCFVSHGEPNEPILPIHCDIAYLLGKRSLFRHEKNRSCFERVLYHGHKEKFKKIKEINFKKDVRIGIFLSKSTSLEHVVKLSFLLTERFKTKDILIRRHPNMKLSSKEKEALLKIPGVEIGNGESIDKDVEGRDFIFAGDTTVHIDVLLRGCPSLYYRDLEETFFDRYGYVGEGVVLEWNINTPLDDINNFYQNLNRKNRIGYYLNIEKDSQESIQEIDEIIFQ